LAKQHFEKAMAMRQVAYGERHPEVAKSTLLLARASYADHEIREAHLYYLNTIQLIQENISRTSPALVEPLVEIAEVAEKMGAGFTDSDRWLDRAVAIDPARTRALAEAAAKRSPAIAKWLAAHAK